MDQLISVCSALLLLLPLGLTPGPAWAQMDSSFCSSTGNASGPSPPVLGRSFQAEVELKLGGGAAWLYMQEFLDSPANMAAVRVWGFPQPGSSTLFISDYNSQRYTTIQGDSCMETKLEPTDIFALPFNVNHGKDQVMSAFGGLELGRRSGFRYLGKTTVRNITALAWDSCVYSNSTNQTLHITVYFSDSPWVAPSGEERVPLRNIIRARRHLAGGQVQDTTQQLDFLYFHSNLTDTSVFRAASGLYCQGRQSTRRPPTLPRHFSYRAEVLLPETSTMDAYNIWYDFDANIVRLDSKPLGGIGDVPMLPRREVHDFNAGVSYMVALLSGQCHVVPLSVDSMDTRFLDPGHVTISTPQQLFHLDGDSFAYSGQVVERGVTMDTWTGTRQDFPPGENASSVWEWSFSSSEWLVNQFGPMTRQVPTRLKITLPSVSNTFIHNIFDFTNEKPDPSVFDVTDCYEAGDIHYVQLKVSGDVTPAASLPRQFRLAATRSLMITMALTPVRVQRVQTQVSRSEVTIQFTLLGPAPVPGDVKTPKAVVTSQNALDALRAVVNAGKFFFDVTAPLSANKTQAAYRLTGVAGSVTDIGRQSPSPTSPSPSPSSNSSQDQGPRQPQHGWGIGAVAGLAVGMAVAGALLGVLVSYLASQACDRKPKFERFQFDRY